MYSFSKIIITTTIVLNIETMESILNTVSIKLVSKKGSRNSIL